MMLGWVLIAAGLSGLVLAMRIGSRGARGITQGAAVLLAAIGGLVLMRRPQSGVQLPGYGPRQWRQP
ncbi:hypothetical protein [Falsiroseomonas sp. HW251]|uniref:hypothetical protein n=1 Tax=Falsiroseomonas sp. HW251 TaxID=3390998 RepID=UPI003D3141D2